MAPSVVIQPASLDFGKVAVQKTVTASVLITNTSGTTLSVTVGTPEGVDAALFTLTPPAGSILPLADKEAASVSVKFTPVVATAGPSTASFVFQICLTGLADCARVVTLKGQGVTPALTATPDPLEFGFVSSTHVAMKSVLLTNVSTQTVQLTANPAVVTKKPDGTATLPNVFSLPGAPLGGTMILPGQTLAVSIDFGPVAAASYLGELVLVTDDPVNPGTKVSLTGTGGGPSIACTPLNLDFGLNPSGIPATQTVTCTNVGQSVPGHPEANLFIPDPHTSNPGLTILNGDPSFQATFHQPFPVAGLIPGQSTQIDVTYNAAASGQNTDTLAIASNDPVSPKTDVALTGSAMTLQPCSYQVSPAGGIAFGRVKAGLSAVLPFEIINNGAGACLVERIQLQSQSAPAFSLPDYPASSNKVQVVDPGATLEVNVQFAPNGSNASFGGTVTFAISNPTTPQGSVAVTGSSSQGCLVFDQTSIDFGVTGFDPVANQFCGNGQRTVTVWNLCDQDVVLSQIDLVDTRSPSAFTLVSPVLPIQVPGVCTAEPCLSAAPTTFTVFFAPNKSGAHAAGIRITAGDLADPYLVPLQGEAQQNQGRTENFTGHAAALDVLWVVDNNTPSQSAVAQALLVFLQLAEQDEVDYRMGSTTTDLYGGAGSEDGRMEPCPGCKKDGGPLQVVTGAQGGAAAAAALAPLINLGSWVTCSGNPNPDMLPCSGQLFEAATQALSPPLLQNMGYNQGFLRPDAFLAVFLLTNDNKDDLSASRGLPDYYDALLSLKGVQHANRFSLSRVSHGAGLGTTQRLSVMSQAMGGIEADPLLATWPDDLNAFWPKVGAQLRSYPLSATPQVSSLQISANGVQIPPAFYTYDRARRAVQFDPLGLPQPGDSVVIAYTLGCGN